jgi:hypothetical protein
MQKHELKKTLKKLGAGKLSSLIGIDRVESICSIMQEMVTENQLVDILIARYGTQILAKKDVRISIIKRLPKESLSYILSGEIDTQITSKSLEVIEKANWSRTSAITKRILNIFDLGEEYLPPEKPKISSEFIIEPNAALYPYQKRVKDRLVRALLAGQNKR